jgi:hypothetical protein
LQHFRSNVTSRDHTVYAALADRYVVDDYGGTTLKDVSAERLHLNTGAIAKRPHHAEVLGPRWSFTGEKVEPVLAHTVGGLARGELGVEHVEIIRKAVTTLPGRVDDTTRADAQRDLAGLGAGLRPEDLQVTAKRLVDLVDPDGAEPRADSRPPRREGFRERRQHRHRRIRPGLRPRQPTRRKHRLDHPPPRRPHRMDPTPITRHRTEPRQPILPPAALPAQGRIRR